MNRALALCLILIGLSIVRPALANDTVYYYYNDAQGSPVAVTDASGNVIERTQYAPYGQVLNRAEHDGPGYTKHEEDAATGLTNMQQRYDDKAVGRMLSMDPMDVDPGTGANFNRYAYANDNPYRFTDPDGRESGAGYATGEYTTGVNQPELDTENSAVAGFTADALNTLDNALAPLGPDGGAEFHAAIAPAIAGLKEIAAGAKVASKAEQLANNVKQGAAAEKAVAAKLGDQVAGTHVTLESSTGQRSVADIVTKDQSVVEVKSGGAQLSSGQKAVQADINAGRPVTPRGQNAANAGLKPGQPTQMKCYKVDQC